MESKKLFLNNLFFAFIAQAVSIVVSLIMTLGIPKFLSMEQYGYWQLFNFYIGYIGLFLFGISDALFLKYGGKIFDSLDKQIVKSELLYTFIFQLFFASIVLVFPLFGKIESNRTFIFITFAIFMIVGNASTLLSFLLMATNDIKYSSKAILIEKLSFVILLLVAYFLKGLNVYVLILLFIFTKVISLIFLLIYFKTYRRTKIISISVELSQIIGKDVSLGLPLMLSNIASTLIVGAGRFIIDSEWDVVSFGKVSLALSATYFFLLFVYQISLTLFPFLKRMNFENQKMIFGRLGDTMSVVFLSFYLLYYPLVFVLSYWIPQYKDSFVYISILMPICLYDGKMQMIHNTYLKSFNKQNKLLIINIITLVLSIVLSIVGGYLLHSLVFIVYSMSFCIALRSVVSELYLNKIFEININWQLYFDVIFTIIFLLLNSFVKLRYSFIVCTILFCVLLVTKREKMMENFKLLKIG